MDLEIRGSLKLEKTSSVGIGVNDRETRDPQTPLRVLEKPGGRVLTVNGARVVTNGVVPTLITLVLKYDYS